jgi:hypothetical protein
MNSMIRISMGSLLLLLLLPAQAAVRASFDRPQVIEGDPVILTIRKDGSAAGEEPDLTPLAKDFDIEGSSQGSQVSIVNGRRSDLTYWSIRLAPKHTGTFQIPPISIGKEQSNPLTLKVLEVPVQTAALPDQPLFLEMKTDSPRDKTYVQQEIPLTVRLFYRDRLQQGSLSDPAPEKAVVERLGEDKQYRTLRNGQEYHVIERHYAIFPEKSGELRIPPVVFRGQVSSPSSHNGAARRRGDLFGRFFGSSPFANDPFFKGDFFSGSPFGNPGKPVSARSQALTLQVAPRPAGYQGSQWLPAEAVTLEDSWSQTPPLFRVGEPVTRTITLQAKGLEASQISPLELPQPAGFRLYATLQGKNEETLLPQWQVQVQTGTGPIVEEPSVQAPAVTADDNASTHPSVEGRGMIDTIKRNWPWLLAGLLAVITLLLLWRRSAEQHPPKRTTATDSENRSTATRKERFRARDALKQACEKGDPRAAATALLDLAAIYWPDSPPRNLGAIANRLKQGGEPIRTLERTLYAPTDLPWNSKELWEAVAHGLSEPEQHETISTGPLPPLYPV